MKDEGSKADEAKGRKDKEDERAGRKGGSLEIGVETAEDREKETAVGREGKAGDHELGEADMPEFEVRRHKIGRRPLLPTRTEIDDKLSPTCQL